MTFGRDEVEAAFRICWRPGAPRIDVPGITVLQDAASAAAQRHA